MKLIGADYLLICNDSFDILPQGGILYENGKIIEVGNYQSLSCLSLLSKQYFPKALLMPALCNLHTHLEFSQNQGLLEYGDFGLWLNSVIKSRQQLMDEGLQDAMQQAIAQLLQSGVGTIGAISSYGYDLEPLAQSPLRVFYFTEAIGANPNMADALYQDTLERFCASKAYQSNQFYPALALHSPYSVHPNLAKQVITLAKEQQVPISVHFLESAQEREWLCEQKGYFASFFKEFFQIDAKPFYTPQSFLSLFEGLQSYFVHLTYASQEEKQIISNLQSTIISCPRSNRLLTNTYLPLEPHYCLATDGLSSNYSLSVLDELRAALFANPTQDLQSLAKNLILSITANAYRNHPHKGGQLHKGYFADFAIFEYSGNATQIPLQFILYAKEAKALFINGEQINPKGNI